MPGVVKIGKTNQAPSKMVKEFDSSGVQKTFYLEFSAAVDDAGMSESRIHVKLSRSGFKVGPELFRISVNEAIKIAFSLIDDWNIHSYRRDHSTEKLINDLEFGRPSRTIVHSTSLKNSTHDLNERDQASLANKRTNDSFSSDREVLVPQNLEKSPSKIGSGEFIYILSNPSMPGYVKVGRTNTTLEQRLSELHSTGVPARFELELGLEVESSVEGERKAHNALSKFRPEKNREFFKIPVKKAIETVLSALDDYQIHTFRKNYGIESLIYETALKSREFRKKRQKEITKIKSELIQVDQEVARLKESLRQEEDRYKSLGPYPDNPLGGIFTLAVVLFPVALILAGLSFESSETVMLFLIVTFVCMFAVNHDLDNKSAEKAIPFNESQKRLDALKNDLYPLQRRAKELMKTLNDLGEDVPQKRKHSGR